MQGEIAEETAKDALNPMALGVRYVEVETICREMKAQAAVSLKRNLDALTSAQKAKLQVLQDAIKLAPVISDAQSGNLLATSGFFQQFFSTSGNGNFSVITGLIGPASGCYFPPQQWFDTRLAGAQPTQEKSR